LSKVIKSFNNRNNRQDETKDVVIGIQPITALPPLDMTVEDDDPEAIANQLKKEAARILNEAREEAARIKAESDSIKKLQHERMALEEEEWRLKLEKEAEAAKQKGYEAGFANGNAQGMEEWRTRLDEVNSFIDKTRDDYHRVIDEAEPQVVLLAIKTAEKIIGQKLSESPDTWVSLVKQLIKEAREYEEVKLYVPTGWFDLTLEHRNELKNIMQSTSALFIYPDENLKENGAVIEFPFGKIDAALDVQLKEIKEKLLEQIEVSENER
jgi:flagellar assembly protein FliH